MERKRVGMLLRVFLLLCGMFLTGCGKEEEVLPPTEYYELSSVVKRLFDRKKEEDGKGMLLGMQFYQGEPVQIWSGMNEGANSVFLQRQDGGTETLLEEVQNAAAMEWYLDEEGCFYCWSRDLFMALNGEDAASVRKLDKSGAELFCINLDPGIEFKGLCQLADGQVVLLVRDKESYDWKLARLDSDKGKVTMLNEPQLDRMAGDCYIASGGQGLLLLNDGGSGGIYEINMKDGSRILEIPFMGTNYSIGSRLEDMKLEDFRVQEDGTVAMLWAEPEGGQGRQETLSMQKVEKTPVVVRTTYLMDEGWLEARAGEFNAASDTYHVIIEYGDGSNQMEVKDATLLEISIGKGPDILYQYMLDGMGEAFLKGGFENLTPYMESSGMREEDYFPAAFSGYRDGEKIYTVRPAWRPVFSCTDKAVLGGNEEPNIEELVDALLAWEEDALYGGSANPSAYILTGFMGGSEDFWGMLDWKAGKCDFSGELFAKMLQAAKRYGYTWKEIYAGTFHDWPLITSGIDCSLYRYETMAEMEKKGFVITGSMFEDGCYATQYSHEMLFAVNVNARAKQGAWEFLSYLMSEEVQKTLDVTSNNRTNRAAFLAGIEEELKKLDGGYVYSYREVHRNENGEEEIISDYDDNARNKDNMTQERIEEYISALENSRDLLSYRARVQPIMNIIEEEAEYYFLGEKGLEETVDIINNRVNLYMGEHK